MKLTHLDTKGYAQMVGVGEKDDTQRSATAEAFIYLNAPTFQRVMEGGMKKGNVLFTANLAGIMAAKKTWELIPLCHPIMLTGVTVEFFPDEKSSRIGIRAKVSTVGKTGVEMEALQAVSQAALTIYDMCKAVQRDIRIEGIRLLEKEGGRSGHYLADVAHVVSVNISEKKGEQKHPVAAIHLKKEHGILGDAHAGNWHRQVSLLAEESVDSMRNKTDIKLTSGVFAENINTRGLDLAKLPVGTRLKIGEAVLRVTQIGKECHNDCAIRRAAGDCVMPTQGIFAVVEEEGSVHSGMPIEIMK